MSFTPEQREDFEALSRPLIHWLNENMNPHAKIIIETTGAELVSGEMAYVTHQFIKG